MLNRLYRKLRGDLVDITYKIGLFFEMDKRYTSEVVNGISEKIQKHFEELYRECNGEKGLVNPQKNSDSLKSIYIAIHFITFASVPKVPKQLKEALAPYAIRVHEIRRGHHMLVLLDYRELLVGVKIDMYGYQDVFFSLTDKMPVRNIKNTVEATLKHFHPLSPDEITINIKR